MKTLLLLCFFSLNAIADYAWIPRHQHLSMRLGGEYFRSSENFLSNGSRDDIAYNGQLVDFSRFGLFAMAEYGLADGLAASVRIPFQMVSVHLPTTSKLNSLSSNGLGDIDTAIKYRFKAKAPILTAEINFRIPTQSYYISTADELLRSNGSFEIGGTLHAGHQFGVGFFDLSPGVLIRFNGYSSAFVGKGMIGAKFAPAYFFAFTNFYTSFGSELLFDSSTAVHDAGGTGGSYALLSGSPSFWEVGLKAAARIVNNYYAEASFSGTLWGRRAPNFFMFGLNLVTDFDLSTPDTRTRVKEIPFDSPRDTPYSTEPDKKEKRESTEKTESSND